MLHHDVDHVVYCEHCGIVEVDMNEKYCDSCANTMIDDMALIYEEWDKIVEGWY